MALGKVFASRNRSCAYLYIFSRQMEAFVFSILKTLNTFGTHGTKFLRTANRLLRAIFTFRCSLARIYEQTNVFFLDAKMLSS